MPEMIIDEGALERDNVMPFVCRKCKNILATQSADGNTLYVNQNAHTKGTKGIVSLVCKCGVSNGWRPSRGAKTPAKPTVSEQQVK